MRRLRIESINDGTIDIPATFQYEDTWYKTVEIHSNLLDTRLFQPYHESDILYISIPDTVTKIYGEVFVTNRGYEYGRGVLQVTWRGKTYSYSNGDLSSFNEDIINAGLSKYSVWISVIEPLI